MSKCSGKTKHEEQRTAEVEAKRLNLNKRWSGVKWRSYHCSRCSFYHVGRPADS